MEDERRFNPTWELLAKPYGKRILRDWVFWASAASIVFFALATKPLPLASRADIVRGAIGLCVPITIGLLAIVVAAYTIFSTLATEEFRESLEENYEYLTSFFFMAMSATLFTMVYSVILFLLSYTPTVTETNQFFWACMVGLGSLLFCILQVLDTGRTVSLQALALKAIAEKRKTSKTTES
jgi:hypothetical protein